MQVFKVMLDHVQPLAAKVVDLGDTPGVQQAFMRVSSCSMNASLFMGGLGGRRG